MNTIFIGIAGGTGSGKTTLTEHLVSRFGDDIAVVHHDNYYKRQDCSFEERCKQNYDHPDAFDTDLMIQDLKKLKAGQTIYCPVYDYALHNRTDQTVEIRPAKVIIVEGILIFQNKELRDLLDIKIFVETDADVRILRRALRDVEERGRSMQSVVTQYLTTVKPMHEQFVEPIRKAGAWPPAGRTTTSPSPRRPASATPWRPVALTRTASCWRTGPGPRRRICASRRRSSGSRGLTPGWPSHRIIFTSCGPRYGPGAAAWRRSPWAAPAGGPWVRAIGPGRPWPWWCWRLGVCCRGRSAGADKSRPPQRLGDKRITASPGRTTCPPVFWHFYGNKASVMT